MVLELDIVILPVPRYSPAVVITVMAAGVIVMCQSTEVSMNQTQARERISKLKKEIERHRYLYHVLDKQEISDAAWGICKEHIIDFVKLVGTSDLCELKQTINQAISENFVTG